ncbi:MAG: polyphosphate kinase 1 [Lentimicrobiaceae bacterium]|nr:polyphosphate kinase 1 [Lentimicrobiaceae bacterium]
MKEKTRKKFINREISWLEFNARVLQEAEDNSTPLLERLRFLGIFSNNLDEFYRVRVATLNRLLHLNKNNDEHLNFNPKKVLKEINRIDKEQQTLFGRVFRGLVHKLAHEGIRLINEKQLSPDQMKFVLDHFNHNVRSQLFPIMLPNLKSSALPDDSIYLGISLTKSQFPEEKERFAVIRIPTPPLSRFVLLPSVNSTQYIMMLDDVIRFGLSEIFNIFGYDCPKAYTFKFTRDAELDIDNDVSKSFLEVISESIKQRKSGAAVRFVYDKTMPAGLLNTLKKKLNISENDTLIRSGRYHNFKDFINFPPANRPDLSYASIQPLPHPMLPPRESILTKMAKHDVMLHYPYQSFQTIIDLLREASLDPAVKAIKMTLYRLARDSKIINALINAARNGKSVTVFMELQARFDEEANIYWAGRLQEEGVRLIQGIPGFKVHCKLLLIRRKEEGENVYYANIGTGNFNEETAYIYADDSLLTSHKGIVGEVNKVFHLIENKYNPPLFKHLVVSPFQMRNQLIRLINNEIKWVKKQQQAHIILKMNNLVDDKIIKKLYQASNAGVKINIICRGTCTLIPGVAGQSEYIEVISIVDRFLEHSRIFYFHNNGESKYYLSSADLMIRNLDNRIEVACPVYDKEIQQELKTMLEIQLSDNTKARLVNHEIINSYKNKGMLPAIRSQREIYTYLSNI